MKCTELQQKEVITVLNKLVNTRTNIADLNEFLTKELGVEVSISDVTEDKDECDTCDWNLVFSIDELPNSYFDIFYLKMRKKSFFNDDIFITEIAYQF